MSVEAVKTGLISVFIDGTEVKVPKGTLVIRAAEMIGVDIPRFCDHPLLEPVGACRECMVEIPDAGNGRGMPKPQASCTIECAPGMQVLTQQSSEKAEKAQRGVLELLLINHPLDCPICDKGGECPLQNQALNHGDPSSRYGGAKRTFPKPVSISAQVLLDRERCVLCARCTRFSEQISGDPFIALVERGALQQVGFYEDHPYDSYFSGNVIQICPVGALTSADYRFQARPFDLVSTTTTCELCASGCQLRADHRHFQVKRRLAGDLPEVNEEWNCDRGRFDLHYGRQPDRLTAPLIREDGKLRAASWPEAIDAAVAGLQAAGSSVGVLTGGRLTLENAYAYSKFARAVLGTNDIDFRSRLASEEEACFLGNAVAGKRMGDGVTYADLQAAAKVICVAFEPEEESPIVFLRLRKAARKNGLAIQTVAPYLSNGFLKLAAELIPVVPGNEGLVVPTLEADADTVILVGERAAGLPGTFSALMELTERTGAQLAWVPRRAGDRGAIEAGCLPGLLPSGRPVADASARVDAATIWGADVPVTPGRNGADILAAAACGDVAALVVAGVQPTDFADAKAARAGLEQAGFVISLESRQSEVTERADVVFPVDLVEDQAGTFWNWEHRPGRVNRVIKHAPSPMTDVRALAMLSDALGKDLGFRAPGGARAEFEEFGPWEGARLKVPHVVGAGTKPSMTEGLVLASWRQLIDGSAANDGATALLATAKPSVVRLSPATSAWLAVSDGDPVTVCGRSDAVTLPLVVEDSMVDGVVWIPGNRDGLGLGELGVVAGATVEVNGGAA